jgi:hypothetical protein
VNNLQASGFFIIIWKKLRTINLIPTMLNRLIKFPLFGQHDKGLVRGSAPNFFWSMSMILRIYGVALSIALLGSTQTIFAGDIKFQPDNQLAKPEHYREWMFLGASITPNDLNDGKASFPGFHNVYMDPSAWKKWKAKGEFADGTMIVKEIVSVGDHQSAAGKGYFQGDFSGIGVMVKDRKRFPKEPGNWAYFTFDKTSASGSLARAQPTANCATCHQVNAATDLVFSQYYPVLRQLKP